MAELADWATAPVGPLLEDDLIKAGAGIDGVASGFLDALVHPAALLDAQGVIVLVNVAWTSFAQQNGAGEICFTGLNYLRICEGAEGAERVDGRVVFDGLRAILSGDERSFDYTYACHSQTRRRWYKLIAARIGSTVLVQHIDVTEAYEALPAHTLADHYAQLAHDLLNPLNALLGFISLARDGMSETADRDRLRRHVDLAAQSASTLQQMFVDMMTAGRDAGNDNPVPVGCETVRIGDLVHEVCSTQEVHAGTVTVHVVDGLLSGTGLVASAIQLRRILQNTLSNAIKYNRPHGTVTVSLDLNKSGGVELSVSDTGIGISEDEIPQVFEKYRRLERGERIGDGFGIGLSVVQDLVHAHDGDIGITSALGVGTTVSVMFPAWRTVRSRPTG